MANMINHEIFHNAIIDVKEMSITEYDTDSVRCYDLGELLKRWDGIVGIDLIIKRIIPLPPDRRDDL